MKSTDRRGLGWTKQEDDFIRQARPLGMSCRDIAKRVGRTPDAVAQRCHSLGVKLPNSPYKSNMNIEAPHWTQSEDAALIDAMKAGMSYQDAADLLAPRTVEAIKKRAKKLGVGFMQRRQKTIVEFEPEQESDAGSEGDEGQKIDRLIAVIEQNSKTVSDLAAAVRRLANLYEHALAERVPDKPNGAPAQSKNKSIVSRLFT